jgi:cytochrome d ubiquinol oxidase subunit I
MITIIVSGLTGSKEMGNLLVNQPLKYSALDGNPVPGTNFPDRFFGTVVGTNYVGGFSIPGMQSFLAQFETGITNLPGLSQFPQSSWPPLFVNTTFNLMSIGGVALGVFLLFYFAALIMKRRPYESRRFLMAWVPAAVVAMLVYQLGWATDELGRQPWILYNVMSVAQAANTSSELLVPGVLIILFYLIVVPASFYLYARVFRSAARWGVAE